MPSFVYVGLVVAENGAFFRPEIGPKLPQQRHFRDLLSQHSTEVNRCFFYLKYMQMPYVSVPSFVNFGVLSTIFGNSLNSDDVFIDRMEKSALRSCFQLKLLLFETPIFGRAAITWYFRATSSSLCVYFRLRASNNHHNYHHHHHQQHNSEGVRCKQVYAAIDGSHIIIFVRSTRFSAVLVHSYHKKYQQEACLIQFKRMSTHYWNSC